MTVYVLTERIEGGFIGVFETVDAALRYVRKEALVPESKVIGTKPWVRGINLRVTVDGEDDWYDILPREVQS